MSDILELWSEPWHELQRRLASRLPYEPQSEEMHSPPAPRIASPGGGTWLLRAWSLAQRASSHASP
jgi:hypothetical protein